LKSISSDRRIETARVAILDHGRLRVATEFVPLLRTNGLDTFDRIMTAAGGRMMRSVPGRSTVRIELESPGGGKAVAFLKRYTPQYLSTRGRWLRRIHWPGARDEALHEWRAMEQLRAHGFHTAAPIAFGQARSNGIVTRSFLLTAEIVGGVAAHHQLPTLEAKARRELLLAIAALTRRFHGAGFAHKDYYLSHIFVVPLEPLTTIHREPSSGPRLHFIDLQRLVRPRLLAERWVVKDLAALGYSAQLAGATEEDLREFLERSVGHEVLTARGRRLLGRVRTRIRALQRRKPKYDVIWDQPGAHPHNV